MFEATIRLIMTIIAGIRNKMVNIIVNSFMLSPEQMSFSYYTKLFVLFQAKSTRLCKLYCAKGAVILSANGDKFNFLSGDFPSFQVPF